VSTLTKVFVVLQVILSIILTSGVVVWVNRAENFQKANQMAKASAQAAERERTQLASELSDNKAETARQLTLMQNLANSKQDQVNTLNGQLTQAQTEIASLRSQVDQTTAAVNASSQAQQVAQKTLETQTAQFNDLRKSQDATTKRLVEAELAISQMTNRYQVTNAQWRQALEQVAQLQGENKNLREQVNKAGGNAGGQARVLNSEPLVKIQGTVSDKRNIGGIPFATISVGASDQVAKGMTFRVIDPKSNEPFLGYVTITQVEPNQAIGRLSGPRIDQVRAGNEVRTQL
jgi:hypothetical protein